MDIINEAKALTFMTGNEYVLVKLMNGKRACGDSMGIEFQYEQIKRIFGHTHPTNAPPSKADVEILKFLGQSQQTVLHGGQMTKVRPSF